MVVKTRRRRDFQDMHRPVEIEFETAGIRGAAKAAALLRHMAGPAERINLNSPVYHIA